MRPIKFRGKRVDNGEWVEGCLHVFPDGGACILTSTTDPEYVGTVEVIPETVGQFSGLKDMSGVDIYEGDVCTAEAFAPEVFHEITFADCAFCAKNEGIPYCNDMGLYMCSKYEHSSLTIIGNIHDNPELVEQS